MHDADSLPDGVEPHDDLNDAQRRVVDAALDADAGLFVGASVPGSGKTYASARLCAGYLLRRAAAGVDRPAAGLAAVAFNRDAAGKLVPEIAGWVRYLVADGATPAARAVDGDAVPDLLAELRRSGTVGTIDSLINRVFAEIAGELGFADVRAESGYALDRLHADAFEAVQSEAGLDGELARLREAYPSVDDEDDGEPAVGDDAATPADAVAADGAERLAGMLRTLLEAARDHGWTVEAVGDRLREGRDAFYPDGPPSSVADISRDVRRFADGDAVDPVGDDWNEEAVVEMDRALHAAWGDRIDDLVAVYRAYVAAYDRLTRERGVVSHVDCAYWVARYFDDPDCADRWADDDTPADLVRARRDRLHERWRARVDLLVVDEAQDVSTAQHDALATLVTDGTRVVLYGDPFQSIYTWRNASPTLFGAAIADGEYFGRSWPDPVVEAARTTYRQRPALAHAVNGVFGPALNDPGRGVAPGVDADYAPLVADRETTDGPSLHVAAFRPNPEAMPQFDEWYADDTGGPRSGEALAEYLHGGLLDGLFVDGDEGGDGQTGDDGATPPPIRVLFRSSTAMDVVREAFEEVGLTVGTAAPVFAQPLARTVVALLRWLVAPTRAERTTVSFDAAAAESRGSTLAAVADHVEAADGDAFAAAERTADGDTEAATLLAGLVSLADDVAERSRESPTELVRRLCGLLAVDEGPSGVQPGATRTRRRRVRDAVVAAVDDVAGPETPLSEVVTALTAMCAAPDDGPALSVDPDDYDVVFDTIHSYKGGESEIVALADPAHSPHGRSYMDTVVARGETLSVRPPAIDFPTAAVAVDGYGGGLFDPAPDWEARESGLRWVTNQPRGDSASEYAGPPAFAAVAAQERAEHWRLGYVAATRARDHLVVPVENAEEWDPRASWSHAVGAALGVDALDGMATRERPLDGSTVRVSKDDVSTRDPLVDHHPEWDGRTPAADWAERVDIDGGDRAWLPRFLNASTFYPLSEEHDRYVLAHLLGKQLDTESGATDTDAPLGVVGPGTLGRIAHDALGSLVRSNPDRQAAREGDCSFGEHVHWALRRAQLDEGLSEDRFPPIREYLETTVLPAFVETDAFARLCAADEVYVEEPLETRTRVDGVRIEVRGQADFVARDGDDWAVEDVKLALAEGADETDERYRLQLATYQWVLRRQDGADAASISGRITHVGGRDDELRVRDAEDVAEAVTRRLDRLGSPPLNQR